ncbi:hypothetical protein HB13667_03205 [Pseudomonas putida]|uniref:Uncharacterized protein n=1 Tax=Pseudomonas putida TaxID=303 RepID=A0A0P7DRX0_PSEPU|nr:hypothetical protein HB13667_03205 [Pseudomonas putida]
MYGTNEKALNAEGLKSNADPSRRHFLQLSNSIMDHKFNDSFDIVGAVFEGKARDYLATFLQNQRPYQLVHEGLSDIVPSEIYDNALTTVERAFDFGTIGDR